VCAFNLVRAELRQTTLNLNHSQSSGTGIKSGKGLFKIKCMPWSLCHSVVLPPIDNSCEALLLEFLVDARIAVDSVVLIVHDIDHSVQFSVRHLLRAGRPFAPSVVAAAQAKNGGQGGQRPAM
jgi:hypothetical protein